jgi:hypothetical protein
VVAVGGEEVERSISRSALDPSKKLWIAYLREVLGDNYVALKSHALQVNILFWNYYRL